MRKRLIVALVLLNTLLAGGLYAAQAQVWPFAFWEDCCVNAGTPEGYCCRQCCIFTNDCNDDEDCRDA